MSALESTPKLSTWAGRRNGGVQRPTMGMRTKCRHAHSRRFSLISGKDIVTRIAHLFVVAAVAGPTFVAAQNPKTQPRTHTPQPTSAAITAADLQPRLYIFAADSMEGRKTGTRGHIKATNY